MDVHLVIRAAGERTAGVCARLAAAQLPEGSVTVVQAAPFEEALRQTYAAGIAAGRKWTMTLDADVLLRAGAVAALFAEAERLPPHYAHVEMCVFDNISRLYRHAGNRIYRTELLPAMAALLPEDGVQIRPESYVVREIGKRGHPTRYAGPVAGLHDFEQSYADLYRKAVVHARKMLTMPRILSEMLLGAIERRRDDCDFEVVLRGFCDGLQYRGTVTIDRRQFADMAATALHDLGFEEKPPVREDEFLEAFAGYYDAATRPYPASSIQPHDEPPPVADVRLSARLKRRFEKRGAMAGATALVGAALRRLGSRLEA